MISRDRVALSLNYKEADRIPVDFGGHRSSGISVQAYKALREYLGLNKSELFIYDVIQQLAVIEDDVLDMLGIDVVQLGYQYYKKPGYWKPWALHDGTEVQIPVCVDIKKLQTGDFAIFTPAGEQMCVQKKDCLYFEQTFYPYQDSDDELFDDMEDQLKKIMWVGVEAPPGPDTLSRIGDEAKELRSKTNRAIYGIFGGNLLELGQQAMRIDNFFMELAGNPDRAHAFLDKLLALHLSKLAKYLEEVGPYIDIIGFGDDLGMQTGPQMSRLMFDEFFKPRYEKMWSLIKRKAPHLKICMHSCGSIHALLPSLIEAGLDAVNPVQITCADMEPNKLKNSFGGKITFWGGGCDTRWVLPNGSPKDVEENVKQNIEIFAENGGFVFQQVHNILADVPPENIVAMFDTVKRYGGY